MKDKKLKCCEFCHYRLPVVFSQFSKQLMNLINYSFWMMTPSGFFTRSFHHSVSILTNILTFFLLHLLKIRITPSPGKHINKRKPHNNKFIAIKVHVSRFPVVSNSTKQFKSSILSLWIKIRSLSTRFTKQWINERPPNCSVDPPSWKIYLETNGAAWTWQGYEHAQSSSPRPQKETGIP